MLTFTLRVEGQIFHVIIGGVKLLKGLSLDEVLKEIAKLEERGIFVTLVRSLCVAGWRHLLLSSRRALYSYVNKRMISRKLTIELLLYASGTRQIERALKMIAPKEGEKEIALIIIGKKGHDVKDAFCHLLELMKGVEDDNLLSIDERKASHLSKLFSISAAELQASRIKGTESLSELIEKLVLSRVALLDLYK